MENGRETGLSTKTPYHFGQESPGPEPMTATVEQVPERIITKLVINKEGSAFVPSNFSYLFSKPYLRQSCQAVVPRGNNNGLGIDVPHHFGRAIVLENGEIPIGKFIAGMIKAKGNSLSGGFINDISSISPTRELNQTTPWGLFGSRDGDTEIEIANGLLGLGFRTALPLGYAVLDLEGYRDWLVGKWLKADKDRAKIIEKSFDIVGENNDLPIILSEITGNGLRWGYINYYPYSTASTAAIDKRTKEARMASMARTARLLAREASVFPDQFKHHYIGGLNEADLRDVLNKMSRMQLLSKKEIRIFFGLVNSILQHNADALEKFVRRNNASGDYGYPNIALVCSELKDLDLAFFQQDYEEAERMPKGTFELQESSKFRAQYLARIKGELSYHFYGRFIPDWLVDMKGLDAESMNMERVLPNILP